MSQVKIEVEFDKELRGMVDDLMVEVNRQEGYEAEPARDGTLLDILVHMSQNAWDNRELLKTLFSAATPVIGILASRLPKKPLKITVQVEGQPLTIEAESADDAASLVEKFKAAHPAEAEKVSADSKVQIKV